MPFLPLSDERAYEYVADGLTEDITTLLARMPGFFVIARSSAFVYKGQPRDVRHIGREVGVRYMVEGSVRPLGRQVRVTAQLIDAETGAHVCRSNLRHNRQEGRRIRALTCELP